MRIKLLASPATCLSTSILVMALLVTSAAVRGDDADPVLRIESQTPAPGGAAVVRLYKNSDLLQRRGVTRITVNRDPAYAASSEWKDRPMTYTAVPLASLFEGVVLPEKGTVQFHCLDGFSGAIAKERLLNRSEKGSVAYLAIEDPAHPWPALKPGSPATPGPFYLIWKNPERSRIANEEWPFQLSGFEVKGSLESRFPAMVPDPRLKDNDPVMRGYRLFTTNCFSCHRMNGQGESEVGPDLNVPFGPTEYMGDKYLRLLIRNPQSVRHWPEGRMPESSPEALSDAQIDDLIKYLRHMAGRKSIPASVPILEDEKSRLGR
jgi:mono/diheme cytochrome c family protein